MKNRTLQFSALYLIGTFCLLAACGNDDTAGPTVGGEAAEPFDPCVLVTDADAGQALGAPISETDRPPEANSEYLATCRYVAPRGQGLAVMTVMSHSPQYGSSGFRTARGQPFDIQNVTGLGDDAFWVGELSSMHVLQGDVYFTVSGDIDLGQAKDLATKALARLP